MENQVYDYAVEGTCDKNGETGNFRLCEMATSETGAREGAELTLSGAGYSNIVISSVEVLRRVTS